METFLGHGLEGNWEWLFTEGSAASLLGKMASTPNRISAHTALYELLTAKVCT